MARSGARDRLLARPAAIRAVSLEKSLCSRATLAQSLKGVRLYIGTPAQGKPGLPGPAPSRISRALGGPSEMGAVTKGIAS